MYGDLTLHGVTKPLILKAHFAGAGVNPIDTKLRAKPVYYPNKLPAILGCDGAGIVEKTGSAVTRFTIVLKNLSSHRLR